MAGASAQVLEIKKYPNRRYYDQTHSRHLTLEQIHALVREGQAIRVSDSKTGRDITAKILAQIIIELDSPKLDMLPVPMLHELLRTNQKLVGQFVQEYLAAPFAAFLESQRAVEQQMRSAIGLPQAPPTMADWARLLLSQTRPVGWAQSGPPAPPAGRGSGEAELRAELQQLKAQLQQLQRMNAPSRRQRPPGSSAARRRGKPGK